MESEDIGDDLSFNEDDGDSDWDKNYEPPSSETDSSDDFPVFNEIQNEVSRNKTSAKTNSNGHELQLLLEEDLYSSSDNENIAENQVGLALQGSVCVRRRVKNKSISTQIGKKVSFIAVDGHVIFRDANFLQVKNILVKRETLSLPELLNLLVLED